MLFRSGEREIEHSLCKVWTEFKAACLYTGLASVFEDTEEASEGSVVKRAAQILHSSLTSPGRTPASQTDATSYKIPRYSYHNSNIAGA